MAIINQKWSCDACQGVWDERDGVRNDLQICNGAATRVYLFLCDPCVKRIAELLDTEFPNNKYLLERRAEPESAEIN